MKNLCEYDSKTNNPNLQTRRSACLEIGKLGWWSWWYERQNIVNKSFRISGGCTLQHPIKLLKTMNIFPSTVLVRINVQQALEGDQTIHEIAEQYLCIKFCPKIKLNLGNLKNSSRWLEILKAHFKLPIQSLILPSHFVILLPRLKEII